MTLRSFLTKKFIIWFAVTVVVGGGIAYRVYKSKNNPGNILTQAVQKQDLQQTVLATGQVTSSTDLNLSFKVSGIVAAINHQVGDAVEPGDLLATLDAKDQLASLTSARGALAQAEANYQKVLAGASSEDIQVAQTAVDAAQVALDNTNKSLSDTKTQQATLVENAYRAMLNSSLAAVANTIFDSTLTLTVGGTYVGDQQGQYQVTLLSNGLGGYNYRVSGLEDYRGAVSRGVPLPLGKNGLTITFGTSGTPSEINNWSIAIPNTTASTFVTNYNAYQAALQTQAVSISTATAAVTAAQASLAQARAALALKQAQARPADVAQAQAQILSAQGQVATAEAAWESTVIRAPAKGTITSVDIKIGELATALKEVLVLQDIADLHLEANVSEANIADIKPGQNVSITFDALGPDQIYQGTVQSIDPASTVVSGVVNYKVTAGLQKTDEIKPGMTANMTILTAERKGVLAIPERAVLSKDGKKIVRVVTDPKKKTFREQEVTLGLAADGGLGEVLSGLAAGQEIVTFINQK